MGCEKCMPMQFQFHAYAIPIACLSNSNWIGIRFMAIASPFVIHCLSTQYAFTFSLGIQALVRVFFHFYPCGGKSRFSPQEAGRTGKTPGVPEKREKDGEGWTSGKKWGEATRDAGRPGKGRKSLQRRGRTKRGAERGREGHLDVDRHSGKKSSGRKRRNRRRRNRRRGRRRKRRRRRKEERRKKRKRKKRSRGKPREIPLLRHPFTFYPFERCNFTRKGRHASALFLYICGYNDRIYTTYEK